MNIYEQISANAKKTAVIVALFPLVLLALMYGTVWVAAYFTHKPDSVYTLAETANYIAYQSVPFVILLAFLWLLISYFKGSSIMLATSGAMEISRDEYPDLFSLVENTSKAAGLPMPRIFVMVDDSANAFATGRDPENSAVVFTTGILNVLNKSELEGVVAHELSHIRNRDVRLMMMVITGIGIMTFLGNFILRIGLSSGGGRRGKNSGGGWITLVLILAGLVLLVYGLVLAPIIMYALSRRREYQADASAALLTRNPAGLASALEKINADSRVEALDSMPLMSSACIADAASPKGIAAFFSGLTDTHPPIAKRVEALRQMDGQV